jgi:hypothetical protein
MKMSLVLMVLGLLVVWPGRGEAQPWRPMHPTEAAVEKWECRPPLAPLEFVSLTAYVLPGRKTGYLGFPYDETEYFTLFQHFGSEMRWLFGKPRSGRLPSMFTLQPDGTAVDQHDHLNLDGNVKFVAWRSRYYCSGA